MVFCISEESMDKKNLRRISTTVTAQTEHNLYKLAAEMGTKNIGRVIDKLVRAKMLETRIIIEREE